ncbi:MAG: hypothetical protein U5L10_00215 [Candidatus Moranbacteria bacterium]|nr:hypothetical protein [Candidatus Moranbacteria bacterium]
MSGNSLQEKMDISQIKEDVVVLNDGSIRAVIAVSAVNLDLKADDEQQAIIYSFQRFLTSFDYSFQILISSRKFNVNTYINELKKRMKVEENELLKNQIKDYVDFVEELVGLSSIMSKLFYIVVPFYPMEGNSKGFLRKMMDAVNPKRAAEQQEEDFQTLRSQLFQRVDHIHSYLGSMELSGARLKTEELIELFYNSYNPSDFEYVGLDNLKELEVDKS